MIQTHTWRTFDDIEKKKRKKNSKMDKKLLSALKASQNKPLMGGLQWIDGRDEREGINGRDER